MSKKINQPREERISRSHSTTKSTHIHHRQPTHILKGHSTIRTHVKILMKLKTVCISGLSCGNGSYFVRHKSGTCSFVPLVFFTLSLSPFCLGRCFYCNTLIIIYWRKHSWNQKRNYFSMNAKQSKEWTHKLTHPTKNRAKNVRGIFRIGAATNQSALFQIHMCREATNGCSIASWYMHNLKIDSD